MKERSRNEKIDGLRQWAHDYVAGGFDSFDQISATMAELAADDLPEVSDGSIDTLVALSRHGLRVTWDGTWEKRILVGLDWKRRRDPPDASDS